MKKRKNLVKPKPHTLTIAEKLLHGKKSTKNSKTLAGFTVRDAKGVKEKTSKGKTKKKK